MPPPDPHALQGVLTAMASAAPTDASVCLQLLCVVLVPGWREGGPLGRKVQPLPSQQVQDMAHTTACLLLPSGQIPSQPGCQGCLHFYGPLFAAHKAPNTTPISLPIACPPEELSLISPSQEGHVAACVRPVAGTWDKQVDVAKTPPS